MRISLQIGLSAFLVTGVFAQAPAFDAVSVKPNHTVDRSSSSNSHNGVLTATNISLKRLIMRAYNVREYQITGPNWLEDERYDVVAKPPSAADRDTLAAMMRTMLAERFKLVVHHESKVMPVYGLVVAKGGPRMEEVTPDVGNNSSNNNGRKYEGRPVHMNVLAEFLSFNMDRPVLDMTGLKGAYNVTLNWSPEDAPQTKEDSKEAWPPLAMALQEQIGLKLEPRKAPIDFVVVDSVEKVPTEN